MIAQISPEISRRGRIVLWFDDELEIFERVQPLIHSKPRSHHIHFHIFSSFDEFANSAHDLAVHFEGRPIVACVICREIPSGEKIRELIATVNVVGVVSDLQLGGDALAGLSILSATVSSPFRPPAAVFSSAIDPSLQRLAMSIGVQYVVSKRDDNSLLEILDKWFELRDHDNSRRIRYMQREMEGLRHQCEELMREKRSLKRQLASKSKKPADLRHTSGETTTPEVKSQLENAQQIIQLVLSHNHDLSNTSSLTLKTIEHLCSDPKLVPPVILQDLERARIAAKHCDILVQSLSSISGNERRVRNEASAVGEAVKEVHEILGRKIPEAISINISISDRLPLCSIPAHLLVRVILNLVLNALEAMPKGGTILLEARVRRTKVKVVTLRICDSGIGIRKADLSKVCSPDFSSKGKRQGFGLFIVKRIINEYKGVIALRSERGKGTTVTIDLPTT